MEMPEKPQVEKNNYQIKNINGETFVIHVDNNDEKKFTKVVQITSDGNLIPQNMTRVIGWSPDSQNISNEAEIKKNKVKTIAIISACCLTAILATLYTFYFLLQERIKTAEIDEKRLSQVQERLVEEERQAEIKKAEEERKAEQAKADAKKAEAERKAKEAEAQKEAEKTKQKEAEAKKAEAERKKQEAEREEKREAEAAKREQYLKGRKIGNLIWSDRSASEMNWSSAKQYCENLSEGGYTDWRLPNIDELRTLLIADRVSNRCRVSERNNCLSLKDCWSCSTCTLAGTEDSNHKYKFCSDWGTAYSDGRYSRLGDGKVWLWSSSTQSDNSDNAWGVNFGKGRVGSYSKTRSNYVRCVR